MGKRTTKFLSLPKKNIWKSLSAEFLGCFLLLFVGCGSGLYNKNQDGNSLVEVALCWGLMIATLAQIFSFVSGCHLNPAVTVALLVTGKMELMTSILYIICQCCGALVGVAALQGFTPSKVMGGYGALALNKEVTPLQGIGVEFIITFVLLFIIFAVSDKNRTDVSGSPAFAIGLTVSVVILGTGNLTGAGLNPARALGPAVMTGKFAHHWVYWVGDISGGIVAGLLYEYIFSLPKPASFEIVQEEEMTTKEEQVTTQVVISQDPEGAQTLSLTETHIKSENVVEVETKYSPIYPQVPEL